jgi:hypothetical protein
MNSFFNFSKQITMYLILWRNYYHKVIKQNKKYSPTLQIYTNFSQSKHSARSTPLFKQSQYLDFHTRMFHEL